MLLPVLIHMLGFAGVNAMMDGIAAADADILGIWYAWFAFVDVLALRAFTAQSKPALLAKVTLMVSLVWSLILVAEMVLLRDLFQQADHAIQLYIDIAIGLSLLWYAIDETHHAMTIHRDVQ